MVAGEADKPDHLLTAQAAFAPMKLLKKHEGAHPNRGYALSKPIGDRRGEFYESNWRFQRNHQPDFNRTPDSW
ncbi:MAG: hypothetical protein NTZ03_00005, partial [Actinobacteria bacterium]|nr:hypothetical protein [Actinomycetota bacterium]